MIRFRVFRRFAKARFYGRTRAFPMPSVLDQIIATKREEVAARKQAAPIESLKETIATLGRPRNFFQAVSKKGRKPLNLIAEVKKASPSAGVIRADFDPIKIAQAYAE